MWKRNLFCSAHAEAATPPLFSLTLNQFLISLKKDALDKCKCPRKKKKKPNNIWPPAWSEVFYPLPPTNIYCLSHLLSLIAICAQWRPLWLRPLERRRSCSHCVQKLQSAPEVPFSPLCCKKVSDCVINSGNDSRGKWCGGKKNDIAYVIFIYYFILFYFFLLHWRQWYLERGRIYRKINTYGNHVPGRMGSLGQLDGMWSQQSRNPQRNTYFHSWRCASHCKGGGLNFFIINASDSSWYQSMEKLPTVKEPLCDSQYQSQTKIQFQYGGWRRVWC